MNVVIINTFANRGGAARAANRLFRGLRPTGVSAAMLVKVKDEEAPNVVQVETALKQEEQLHLDTVEYIKKEYIKKNRSTVSDAYFAFPYPGYDLSKLEIIKTADVFNIHWVNDFLSIETTAKLLALGKPVVWTLHDQSPATGGCSYTADCREYQSQKLCADCPQLHKNPFNLPYHVMQKKMAVLRSPNLSIVTPSRWLKKKIESGIVFKGMKIEAIHNALDSNVFSPRDKKSARAALGLPTDQTTVLFESRKKIRKGLKQMVACLHLCLKDKRFRALVEQKKIRLVTFGQRVTDFDDIPIPQTHFGKIESDDTIATLYNAADVYALPSLEDNFPNTMLEATACATPVLAFRTGGIPELIKNRYNGRLVPPDHIPKFAKALLDMILKENRRQKMGLNGRSLIEKEYRLVHQGQKYKDLFLNRLGAAAATPPNIPPYPPGGSANRGCPLDLTIIPGLQPLFEYYQKDRPKGG